MKTAKIPAIVTVLARLKTIAIDAPVGIAGCGTNYRNRRVEAHGAGKILPSEMKIDPKTNTTVLRYAPGFGIGASAPESGAHPYTTEALAKFLGFVKDKNQRPSNSFIAAFGAEELIADGKPTPIFSHAGHREIAFV